MKKRTEPPARVVPFFCSPNHPKSIALVNGSALTSLRVVPLRSSTVDPTRGVRLGGDGRSTSA